MSTDVNRNSHPDNGNRNPQNDEFLNAQDPERNDGSGKARWDVEAGKYTESGPGIADERQTSDRDQRFDAGSYTDSDVAKPNPDQESLTNDEL